LSLSRKEISNLTEVRKFGPEDLTSVVEIASALHPKWFTTDALKEISSNVQTQNSFVATSDRKIVGFASYLSSKAEKSAELTWIGVLPDLHKRGIGRMLVDAIENAAAKEGGEVLEVCTVAETVEYEPYAQTRCFYHALGFRDVRVEVRGFPSGDDKLVLRKTLHA